MHSFQSPSTASDASDPKGFDHKHGGSKIFKANSSSSGRIKAAHQASTQKKLIATGRANNQRNARTNKKTKKQEECLIPCYFCQEKSMSGEGLCLVFDGSDNVHASTAPTPPSGLPPDKRFECLRIKDGALSIADEHLNSPSKGLIFASTVKTECISPFFLFPRTKTLEITGVRKPETCKTLCEAFSSVMQAQMSKVGPLKRGSGKQVFTDSGSTLKYACFGTQTRRAGRGVRNHTFHYELVEARLWNAIYDYIVSLERVKRAFVDTCEIQKVYLAHDLIDYKVFPLKSKDSKGDVITMHAAGACGFNVSLESHVDDDFGLSTACIMKHDHVCADDDAVVVYFIFPNLGRAVPLRPGDVMVFNANEPHCLSTRCKKEDGIYCISFYLKSAAVGLHDNSLQLTPKKKRLNIEFDKYHK